MNNNNISVIDSEPIKNYLFLYGMTLEYNKLSAEEKKRYMDILTEWYMREKDSLRNKIN